MTWATFKIIRGKKEIACETFHQNVLDNFVAFVDTFQKTLDEESTKLIISAKLPVYNVPCRRRRINGNQKECYQIGREFLNRLHN